MVYFQVCSDLHLERFASYPGLSTLLSPSRAPYLVVAGDLGDPLASSYTQFLADASRVYKAIFVVPGNHEYYQRHHQPDAKTMEAIHARLREICAAFPNVHLLDRSGFMLDDEKIYVIGTTLWSHCPQGSAMVRLQNGMSDYRYIHVSSSSSLKNNQRLLTVADTNNLMRESVVALQHELIRSRTLGAKHVMVITHHVPSHACIHPRFSGHPLSHGFVTNLEDIIKSGLVDTWIFGHTHESCDMCIGPCRLVCNPRGYSATDANGDDDKGRVTKYDPALVVTVPHSTHSTAIV